MDQHKIYDKLSEQVYGHHEVKKMLINLVRRIHLRDLQRKSGMLLDEDDLIPLKNVLLIGASGTGKTYLVECLNKVCDFALFKYDATKLAPTSAKGTSVDDIISHVTKSVNKLASNSGLSQEEVWGHVVIFIDEVDKLSKPFDSSGNWNLQIQANLLTLIENKSKFPYPVSFIFAGAFSGMDRKAKQDSTLGFCATTKKDSDDLDIDEALIKYGLMPEFVGRMNNIASLDELREVDYRNILELKLLPEYNNILNYMGADKITFSDERRDKLIKKAMGSGQGIRYLKRALNQISEDLEFHSSPIRHLPYKSEDTNEQN